MNGILVQLPLPAQIDADLVTERIDPLKDVDGFHPYNIGRLVLKRPTLRPCTPYGCMTLLKDTGEDLVGKHAVVIGQSNIVGRPIALELLMARCTVTICHSKTHKNLPGLVAPVRERRGARRRKKRGLHSRATGSSRARSSSTSASTATPRASFAATSISRRRASRASLVAPVPGGVGPMTIATLLANTVGAGRIAGRGGQDPHR